MNTGLSYQNILLCTDYSDDAEASFVHAYDQARKYGAALHILNVIPAINPCGVNIFDPLVSRKKAVKLSNRMDEQNRLQALGALKKVYSDRCRTLTGHTLCVKVGSADVEILEYAKVNRVDMIVMGTAGLHPNRRLTYIRTAANVSKFAKCQVINIGSPRQVAK